MNSTTLAPRAGAVPEPLVDIASISSRLFWLVRNSMSGAAAGLHLPATVFTRFSDAVAARDAIDQTPPLLDHPQGLCRLHDDVIVDGDDRVLHVARRRIGKEELRVERGGGGHGRTP